MSDLQLERSVLEAKERDELFAIALALGSAPAARTKKADLVSRILQVTGVEEGTPAPEKPRRTRSRRSAAQPEAATAETGEQLALDGADSRETAGPDGPAVKGTNGKAVNGSRRDGAAGAPEAAQEPGGAAQPDQPAGDAVPVAAADRAEPAEGARGPAERDPDPSVPAPEAAPSTGRADHGRQRDQQRNERNERSDGQRNERSDGQRNDGQRNDGRMDDPGLGNSRRRRRRNRDKPARGQERDFAQAPAEAPYSGELVSCSGLLDLRDEGYGFLRTNGYLSSGSDVYVSITQVRRYGLRKGDLVEGAFRPAANNEKYPALVRVDTVAGLPPDEARNRPKFEALTPLFPDEKLSLEIPGDPGNVTARIVDLVSPIGKGQRGLIVSPPKAGKTTVLKQIAHSIEANNPQVHLIVLLVDERPEEVTDMRRSVKGEVVASTFDRPADEHTQVAELAIERAKRMVEAGRDVVIVLDGITRLARAYNLAQPATGRIMSGGIDTGALYPPKKFFGSARNIEEGGSLTILATALVETGSRMDEVIFEEFKGTGNMELRLDRKLAERRIYPAIDVNGSSTRHEELLFDRAQLQQVWKLRRVLNALATDGNAAAGLELLVDKIRSTRSNDQFLADIAKTPAPAI